MGERKISHSLDTRLLVNTLLLILTFLVLLNLFRTYELESMLEKRINLEMLIPPPPAFEAVILKDSSCHDCFNITSVLDQVRALDVNLTDVRIMEYQSKEASSLISRYNISFIPTLLLIGVPDDFRLKGFRAQDDTLILDENRPVYIDTESGRRIGMINITIIAAPSCKDCFDMELFVDQIRKVASVRGVNSFDWPSAEAQKYISAYRLTKLPAVVLSPDASRYASIVEQWSDLGSVESDGYFVFRNYGAFGDIKYLDVASGEVKGAW